MALPVDHGHLAPSFLPSTAVLEMTYRCNHACLFCSCPWFDKNGAFDVRPELTGVEWKHAIATLCYMGCNDLAFTGGEPLLKEGLEEIIAYAAGCKAEHVRSEDGRLVVEVKPPTLHLLSNGKAMREEILELCAEHEIQLSMSLPGLTTFAYHTAGDGNAQHILEWFSRAHALGVKTAVGITVTSRNIHELFETISEAFLAGADSLLMNRFMPGGRGLRHVEELSLTDQQVTEMLDTAEEVLRIANRTGSVGTELPKCVVESGKHERLRVATRCSAARDFFVIGPSGHLRVCNHSPVRLNHIDEVEKAKDHPYWRRFIRKDYLPPECGPCESMTVCDGGCREAAHVCGGRVDALDPLLVGRASLVIPRS